MKNPHFSHFPPVLCAIAPSGLPGLQKFPMIPAFLAYQAGNGPRLYRSAPPESIRGGVLMADDSQLRQINNPTFFCQQAIRECRARGATGFCANWSHEPSEAMRTLTAALGEALAPQGLELWVPEPYGDCCSTAHVMISSALSGGTLRQRLTEAIKEYSAERVTLAIERTAADFRLPAPSGQGTPLSPEKLQSLCAQPGVRIYNSPEFCSHYFTYASEDQLHLVLFDTGDSIRDKLLLAGELKLGHAMVAWEEIRDCAEEVFAKE